MAVSRIRIQSEKSFRLTGRWARFACVAVGQLYQRVGQLLKRSKSRKHFISFQADLKREKFTENSSSDAISNMAKIEIQID